MSSFREDNRSWQYTACPHTRLSESEHRTDIAYGTRRLAEPLAEQLQAQNISQYVAYPRR